MSAKAVKVLKHVSRCKICSSPHVDEIDALLLIRSERGKDAEGNVVNLDYVLAKMAEFGIANPTLDNVKGHWSKHREIISADEKEAEREEVEKALTELESGGFEFEDVDEGLRFFFSVGIKNLRRKLAAGEDIGITHDHLLKAAGEITKRRSNEAQAELMKALGGGVQLAFQKALGGDQPKQIESEVIDVEEAEVESD